MINRYSIIDYGTQLHKDGDYIRVADLCKLINNVTGDDDFKEQIIALLIFLESDKTKEGCYGKP